MGAFSYCPKCGGPLEACTPREIRLEEMTCPHCAALLHPNRTMDDLIDHLWEKITELEERIKDLEGEDV